MDFEQQRILMVERQLAARGIHDPSVQQAFFDVPREHFMEAGLSEFAYEDSPMGIGHGQTISQPYIVALTAQALDLRGGERILEVGTGSGYAAAILSCIGAEVHTIERIAELAESARLRLSRLGYDNVHVWTGDGSLGLPEHAPYHAIAVAAGGPKVPPTLLAQLAIGGRLVMPVGIDASAQVLTRIVRVGENEYEREPLGDVRFVPLIGREAWAEPSLPLATFGVSGRTSAAAQLVREAAEPLERIEDANVDALIERIADAQIVLLGEASHGTSEFYRMRARITQRLIERAGFRFVAVEADWPDAARVDDYVLGGPRRSSLEFTPFARFPTWMWRNREVHDFVAWLRAHNTQHPAQPVGFHGLDLYSLFTSIDAVLTYLDRVDPQAAAVARARYGLLTRFQQDPAAYGQAVLAGRYESSEQAVVAMLREMLARRIEYAEKDGERYFDAMQNARLVANAERYYRAMYYGQATSWNLRDSHMFETLRWLLSFYGPGERGIVWEHNSHVGDARATEMSARGEHNVGQLCRAAFGPRAYSIGFGTDHGEVAAASRWGGSMQVMRVRPGLPDSYEALFHQAGLPAAMLHLRAPRRKEVRDELEPERLERAIGVIYRPESERLSHYFHASLPHQFDEYIWFDATRAVQPLSAPSLPRSFSELPDTYPFGV